MNFKFLQGKPNKKGCLGNVTMPEGHTNNDNNSDHNNNNNNKNKNKNDNNNNTTDIDTLVCQMRECKLDNSPPRLNSKRNISHGDNKPKPRRGFRGRHKRTEKFYDDENWLGEACDAQLGKIEDMVISEICRSKIPLEEKKRLMKTVAKMYHLDSNYANDLLLNTDIEHMAFFDVTTPESLGDQIRSARCDSFTNPILDPNDLMGQMKSDIKVETSQPPPPSSPEEAEALDDALSTLMGGLEQLCTLCPNDKIVDRIETLLNTCWQMFLFRHSEAALMCLVIAFVKRMSDSSLTSILLGACKELFLSRNKNMEQGFFTDELFSNIDIKKYTFKTLFKSPLMTYAKVISSVLCTLGLVEPHVWSYSGFEAFTIEAYSGSNMSMLDILDSTLEATSFFFQSGYQCFIKGSLHPLFCNSDTIYSLETRVKALKLTCEDFILENNLDGITPMAVELENLLRDIRQAMHRVTEPEKVVLRTLTKILMDIEHEWSRMRKQSSMRIAPFCIKTYGTSGVGKTTFNKIIMHETLAFNGFACEDNNIRNIEPTSKYMEHINNETTGIIIDDMCNTKAEHDPTIPSNLFIILCNNQKHSVTRAQAEHKDKFWLNPMVVGVTTNDRNLSAGYWSREPASVLRRCHIHVDLTVKDAYKKADGQLDSRLAHEAPSNGGIQDLWNISASMVVAKPSHIRNGPQGFEYVEIVHNGIAMKNVGIYTFLNYLYDITPVYYEGQKKLLESQNYKKNPPKRCQHCKKVTGSCSCPAKPVEPTVEAKTEQGSNSYFLDLAAKMVADGIYSWLGSFTSMFLTIFSLFFRPNWYEKWLLTRLTRQTSDKLTLHGISVIHNMVCNVFTLMPSFIADSPLGNALYVYLHRYTLYKDMSFKFCVYGYLSVTLMIITIFADLHMSTYAIHTFPFGVSFMYIAQIHTGLIANGLLIYYVPWFAKLVTYNPLNPTFTFRYVLAMTVLTIHYCCIRTTRGWHQFVLVMTLHMFVVWSVFCLHVYETYYNLTRNRLLARTETRAWARRTYLTMKKDFPKVCKLSITVGSIGALYFVLQTIRFVFKRYKYICEAQSGVLTPQTVEEAESRDKQTNIWTSVAKTILPKTCYPPSTIVDHVASNLVCATITHGIIDGKYIQVNSYCNALIIVGNCLMMPLHMFYTKNGEEWGRKYASVVLHIKRSPKSSPWVEKICTDLMVRVPNHDLVIFPIHGTGIVRDLVPYFIKNGYDGEVRLISRSVTGDRLDRMGRTCGHSMKKYLRSGVEMNWTCASYRIADIPFKAGDCMTVSVAHSSSPHIVAVHLLGNTQDPYCGIGATLHYEELRSALQNVDFSFVTQGTAPVAPCYYGVDIGLTDSIKRHSPVNFITSDNITVLGSVKGGTTPTSHVSPSLAVPYLKPIFGDSKWGKPKFKSADGKTWQPWFTHLEQVAHCCISVPHQDLRRALKDYLQDIIPIFSKYRKNHIALTDDETINGVPGSRFLTGLNMSTSCGFPMGGKKTKYATQTFVDGHLKYTFTDERIWERWYQMADEIRNNQIPVTIFKATLKDEPTKLDKDKVRVFQAADIAFSLGVRKYFMPLIKTICLHPLLTECAVGINPFSLEWEELHDHVSSFGCDTIVAGDYKGWDMSLPAVLVQCGMEVLLTIARECGDYTPDDLCIMKGIANILYSPLINLDGTLIQYHGTVPSGHNLTSVLNSICNSLILRCAFYSKPSRLDLDFRQYIKNITYGDDFMAGTDSTVAFTLVEYHDYLQENVGMVVTMPDKSSTIRPYMSLHEIDFLKRKSTWLPYLNTHIGVLDINSIHKSLYTTMCTNPPDRNNVFCAVLQSAMHELFYHGEDTYNKYIDIFKHICTEEKIASGDIFLSFTTRVENWHVTYAKTKPTTSCVLDDTIPQLMLAQEEHTCHSGGGMSPSIICNKPQYIIDAKQTRFTKNNKEINKSDSNTIKHERCLLDLDIEQAGSNIKPETTKSAVVQFNTANDWSTHVPSSRDETFRLMTDNDAAIYDVFKRPVPIHTMSWDLNTFFEPITLNVLGAWIANSENVRNKLQHYRYIGGTMCLKLTVNGSAFMYGKALAAAQYWPQMSGSTKPAPIPLELTAMTSLPHISIVPSDGTAGCLSLPLLSPIGTVELTPEDEPLRLILRAMTPLRSIQATSDTCTITVWTWFSDYELSTTCLESIGSWSEQGSDEYSRPLVSTSATGLARFIGKLNDVPYIGPYARASEIGVGAFGAIAELFGYSKPSKIPHHTSMQNRPISNLNHFNGEDSSVKLSLDCKQEVTVDPCVTGYGAGDEMLISHIAQKECYLTTMPWSAAEIHNTLLGRFAVNPGISYIGETELGATELKQTCSYITPTCLAHVSYPFKYWRGTLKYRFEIVASPFHKGKLRLVYNPRYIPGNVGSLDSTLVHSHIIDLSIEREFTMCVGWGSAHNYLKVLGPDQVSSGTTCWSFDPAADIEYEPSFINGHLAVLVVDPLTCASANDVDILVYISAHDDFELQEPTSRLIRRYHTCDTQYSNLGFVEQSGILDVPGNGNKIETTSAVEKALNETPTSHSLIDKLSMIHFGERIVSIRQLCKRYCSGGVYIPAPIPNGRVIWNINDFPFYTGPDTNGMYSAGLLGKYNHGTPANYLNYFAPCFLMRRGSIRNKYTVNILERSDQPISCTSMLVARSYYSGYDYATREFAPDASPLEMAKSVNDFINHAPASGCDIVAPLVKNTIEVEMPFYSGRRWYFAQERDINGSLDIPNEPLFHMRNLNFHNLILDTSNLGSESSTLYVQRHTSAGDDFTLTCYLYPPTLFVLAPESYPGLVG